MKATSANSSPSAYRNGAAARSPVRMAASMNARSRRRLSLAKPSACTLTPAASSMKSGFECKSLCINMSARTSDRAAANAKSRSARNSVAAKLAANQLCRTASVMNSLSLSRSAGALRSPRTSRRSAAGNADHGSALNSRPVKPGAYSAQSSNGNSSSSSSEQGSAPAEQRRCPSHRGRCTSRGLAWAAPRTRDLPGNNTKSRRAAIIGGGLTTLRL
mmetsp:Transcript_87616/g.246106  ORF Transcript_87616/g.246106 Transcript_87616/m.246106 type:complete len:217 (+) Transcript_87616:228-878(+)